MGTNAARYYGIVDGVMGRYGYGDLGGVMGDRFDLVYRRGPVTVGFSSRSLSRPRMGIQYELRDGRLVRAYIVVGFELVEDCGLGVLRSLMLEHVVEGLSSSRMVPLLVGVPELGGLVGEILRDGREW